jgi:hypothetical protein
VLRASLVIVVQYHNRKDCWVSVQHMSNSAVSQLRMGEIDGALGCRLASIDVEEGLSSACSSWICRRSPSPSAVILAEFLAIPKGQSRQYPHHFHATTTMKDEKVDEGRTRILRDAVASFHTARRTRMAVTARKSAQSFKGPYALRFVDAT